MLPEKTRRRNGNAPRSYRNVDSSARAGYTLTQQELVSSQLMDPSDQLLAKISKLKIDRVSGAPHKPLFLLVILDLTERGELTQSLPLTPELAFQFYSYWG